MNDEEEEYEVVEDDEDDDRAWVVESNDPTWKSLPKREEVNPEDVGEFVVTTRSQYRQDKKWGLTKQRTMRVEQTDKRYVATVVTPTKAQHDRKLELQAVRELGKFIKCTIEGCKGIVRYLDPPICRPCWTWAQRYLKKHGAMPTLDEIATRPRRKRRKNS